MRSTIRPLDGLLLLVFISLASGAPLSADDEEASGLETQSTPQGVLVTDSGRKVLFFQKKPRSRDGRYARAGYVHPLWDLDGRVLTEDFPDDHPHHRGVFWAWHQLTVDGKQIGDPWLCQDFLSEVKSVQPTLLEDGAARLEVLSHWKSPLLQDDNGVQKTIVEERTVIVIRPVRDAVRRIDFVISLQAVEQDVRLGGSDDVKGYGGFCVRLRLPDGLRFRLQSGEVQPTRTSVDESPWLDMTAAFGQDKRLSGVSVLTHPDTAGFPQRWILRQKRSMQNPVYPGRNTVAIPGTSEPPLKFGYRLVLHRGEAEAAVVNRWQDEFAKSPSN